MGYVTVFQITQKPYQWWFPAFGLIFIVLGAVLVWIGRQWESQRRAKRVGYTAIVFASMWVLLAFTWTFPEYRRCVDAYRRGNYAVVQGQVEDFHPMPYEGHQDECFSVQSQRFCYSDYAIQPGFNRSTSHGGPIYEGLPVRIEYFDRQILRLDARADEPQSTP